MQFPTVPPTPTPSPAETLGPSPVPSPAETTLVINQIITAGSDGWVIGFGIIASITGIVAAVIAWLTLRRAQRERTAPKIEAVRGFTNERETPYWTVDALTGDRTVYVSGTRLVIVRNWGNGVAYNVRVQSNGGGTRAAQEIALGNIGSGEERQTTLKTLSISDQPRQECWVTWDEYPGPVQQRVEVDL